MKNSVDNLKNLLRGLGAKSGSVVVNTFCLLIIPPLAVLLYSLFDAQAAKIALVLIIPAYAFMAVLLAFFETQFSFVTKFLKTKFGYAIFFK